MTSFSAGNFSFSSKAHLAAERQFYPKLWPGATISFLDTTKAVEDLVYAVDCIAEVSLPDPDARAPIKFYIQERWRKPSYRKFTDMTVTEWNLRTNQPSELHKLAAQLFVYGFYDESTDMIVEGYAVDICRMQHCNARGELKYERRRRSSGDQSFIAIELDHLQEIQALMFDLNKCVETLPDVEIKSRYTKEECRMWGLQWPA